MQNTKLICVNSVFKKKNKWKINQLLIYINYKFLTIINKNEENYNKKKVFIWIILKSP